MLGGVTGRQAVLIRAFLRSMYGWDGVNVSFVGTETFADFVAQHGAEYDDFLADGSRQPRPIEW